MAEQDTTPDELQLKKRARRRLVCAAALALFAVIVLPMVMDREPRPLNQDIQVRIPSQDSAGFAAKLLPAKPAATPMPAPEPKPVVEQKLETQAKSDPAAAASAAVPAAAKPVAQAAAMPAEKPAAKTTEKPAVPEKKDEAADKPAAKPAADAKPASDTPGQWVIQLGAFKEAGNVKILLAKLKGIGVPAYTERLESPQGMRTRVRAGPFASQEAAEKARAKLKIIGVDGPVAPK